VSTPFINQVAHAQERLGWQGGPDSVREAENEVLTAAISLALTIGFITDHPLVNFDAPIEFRPGHDPLQFDHGFMEIINEPGGFFSR
jgi:hypothetical protein